MTSEPKLILGEIQTGLLQSSVPLSPAGCERVLALLHDERVRRFERPLAHAESPLLLVGVDCDLASSTGRSRAIGTVGSRVSITGGQILQSSARVQLVTASGARRLPWSHYLAQPGCAEVIGRARPADLAEQFVAGTRAGTLDIGSIGARAADGVQASSDLDRKAPFRAARTQLRWAALLGGTAHARVLGLRLHSPTLRTAQFQCPDQQASSVQAFAEDLALHDWLLTTLLTIIERSRIGVAPRQKVLRSLGLAVDHLLHLWMPAARSDEVSTELWASLERRPGLGRQWQAAVQRIRDHLALSTVSLLQSALHRDQPEMS